jgi:hypothetical protein
MHLNAGKPETVPALDLFPRLCEDQPRSITKSQSSKTVHSCVAGLVNAQLGATSPTMIKEISQRIYSAAAVCLWVVVVTATSAVILASTVNGGISW